MRLIVYIANRSLWTDEVAVAINLYERGFADLTTTLSLKQYAPPVFLWCCKLSAAIFGYGEKALRLYPLVTGVLSLVLLSNILNKLTNTKAAWYPLLLFATGIFFLRYSTELKQYMPDAFISLFLVWLSLRTKPPKAPLYKFSIIWLFAGSIAIWSSMPSVFVLAGVSLFYGIECIQQKQRKHLAGISIVSVLWLLQFVTYYKIILAPQINSDYLINYHNKYFLYALPANSTQWLHNKDIITPILKNSLGSHAITLAINTVLLLIGTAVLFIRKKTIALLLITPIFLMFCAAALHQYSLIPRLTLFVMPLLLIIVGIGLNALTSFNKPVQAVILSLTIIAFILTQPFKILKQPIVEEEVRLGLDYIVNNGITGDNVFVYEGAAQHFKYYTQIHPDRSVWGTIQNAHIIPDTSVNTVRTTKKALLYTIPFDSYSTRDQLAKEASIADSFTAVQTKVYIFR